MPSFLSVCRSVSYLHRRSVQEPGEALNLTRRRVGQARWWRAELQLVLLSARLGVLRLRPEAFKPGSSLRAEQPLQESPGLVLVADDPVDSQFARRVYRQRLYPLDSLLGCECKVHRIVLRNHRSSLLLLVAFRFTFCPCGRFSRRFLPPAMAWSGGCTLTPAWTDQTAFVCTTVCLHYSSSSRPLR